MKFYIGSLIISIDEVPNHKGLEHFFRRPAGGESSADMHWVVEIVEECDWEYELMERVGNTWITARKWHVSQYDADKNEFKVRLCCGISAESVYWLRRDLFGCFSSVSCQPALHSSGVIYKSEGYIFSAPSETGKSTLFNNLKGYAEQVNDEVNWVYQNVDGNYMMVNQNYYFGQSDCYEVPVHGIYLLEQSPFCSISDAKNPMESFSILLSIHSPFNFHDPFLQPRSAAIIKLQNDLQIKKFKLNRDPKELVATLFNN